MGITATNENIEYSENTYLGKHWIQMIQCSELKAKIKWNLYESKSTRDQNPSSYNCVSKTIKLTEEQLHSIISILIIEVSNQKYKIDEGYIAQAYSFTDSDGKYYKLELINREQEIKVEASTTEYTYQVKVTFRIYSSESEYTNSLLSSEETNRTPSFTEDKFYIKLTKTQVNSIWGLLYKAAEEQVFTEENGYSSII